MQDTKNGGTSAHANDEKTAVERRAERLSAAIPGVQWKSAGSNIGLLQTQLAFVPHSARVVVLSVGQGGFAAADAVKRRLDALSPDAWKSHVKVPDAGADGFAFLVRTDIPHETLRAYDATAWSLAVEEKPEWGGTVRTAGYAVLHQPVCDARLIELQAEAAIDSVGFLNLLSELTSGKPTVNGEAQAVPDKPVAERTAMPGPEAGESEPVRPSVKPDTPSLKPGEKAPIGKPIKYSYRNAAGKHELTVTRYDFWIGTEDGAKKGKDFRQWPTGKKGDLPLFKLPEILAAHKADADTVVIVTEGEKACLALRTAGFHATCFSGGSQATHKTDFSTLAGMHVVLWADADKPGRKAMGLVARRIHADVASLNVILPDGEDGRDAADYPAEALAGMLETAVPYVPEKPSADAAFIEAQFGNPEEKPIPGSVRETPKNGGLKPGLAGLKQQKEIQEAAYRQCMYDAYKAWAIKHKAFHSTSSDKELKGQCPVCVGGGEDRMYASLEKGVWCRICCPDGSHKAAHKAICRKLGVTKERLAELGYGAEYLSYCADGGVEYDLHTDAGIAALFRGEHKGDVLYDAYTEMWHQRQESGLWLPAKRGEVLGQHGQYAEKALGFENTKRGRMALQRAGKARGARTVNETFRGMFVDYRTVRDAVWDQSEHLRGSPSGIWNLKTGALYTGGIDPMITQRWAVDPLPGYAELSAEAKYRAHRHYSDFVDSIADGDDALRMYLHSMCGYLLTGSIELHKFWFLLGKGGTGKSTFLDIVSFILGDYSGPINPRLFVLHRSEPHLTYVADLIGKSMVKASEVPKNAVWNLAMLKTLTGETEIQGQRMHKDPIHFRSSHKILISGNDKPSMRGLDSGVKRRLRIIPFNNKPAIDDTRLLAKLKSEASAILALWIMHAKANYDRGDGDAIVMVGDPQCVTETTRAYHEEENIIGNFIANYLERDSLYTVTNKDLFEHFKQEVNPKANKIAFGREFAQYVKQHKALGIVQARRVPSIVGRDVPGYRGVRIPPRPETPPDMDWKS